MPILKLIVLTVVVVVVVVLVTCGCGSEQPKSVRVRSASVAFRRSVLIVDLRSGSLTVWCRRTSNYAGLDIIPFWGDIQTAPCQSLWFIEAIVTPAGGGVKTDVRGAMALSTNPSSARFWTEKIEQPPDLEQGLAE